MDLYVDRCIKAYQDIAGFSDISDYIDPWHQRGFMKDLERGDMDYDGYMEECKRHCFPGTTEETILRCHKAFFGSPAPEKVAYIHELAKRFDLYILSNNNIVSMSVLRPIFAEAGLPFDSSFKKLFLSYEMRLLKPDAEIFRQAIAASGHSVDEILFIDDSQSNVDGGKAVGLRSVLYKQGDDLRDYVEANL